MSNEQNGEQQAGHDELMSNLNSANQAWPEQARKQMTELIDEMVKRDKNIYNCANTGQDGAVKAGFAAEEMHAETHNLDAILQDNAGRAYTDNDLEWAGLGLEGEDQVADVAVAEDGNVAHKAQSKYYQSADQTAKELRRIENGKIKYEDADSMIAPSDQVDPPDGGESVSDAARKTRLKESENRPQVADAAGQVEDKNTSTLKSDSGESRPVSKDEAEAVAKDGEEGKKIRKKYQSQYKTQSTLKQMRGAAGSAAAISAVMAGTLNTVQYVRLVREGKISTDDAVKEIVKNTGASAGDSALKAAAATGAASTVSQLSAGTVAQQAFSSMAGTAVVGGSAICAVDAVQCMVMVAAGKMTPADMENRLGKNVLQLGVAGFGSHIGLGIASSLGATAGFTPLAAGLAGAMIAGTAVTVAIENHVEKPYREVMDNTQKLTAAGYLMRDTAEAMSYGQQAFAGLIEMDAALDAATDEQLKKNDQAGDDMHDAINRL